MECMVLYKNIDEASELLELIRLKWQREPQLFSYDDILDFKAFARGLDPALPLILSGDDGFITRLVNTIGWDLIKNPLYYFPSERRSDFFREINPQGRPEGFRIEGWLKNLPVVSVKGRDYRFLNGISFGLDAALCRSGKKLSQIKGEFPGLLSPTLQRELLKIKSCGINVSVDGVSKYFKRARLASCLSGKFNCGVSLVPTRSRSGNFLSCVILNGGSALGSCLRLPELLKGKGESFGKRLSVLSGSDISLRFDRPVELMIDGCSVGEVQGYRVRSGEMMRSATPVYQCIPESSANF